jgi:hypothetical protein
MRTAYLRQGTARHLSSGQALEVQAARAETGSAQSFVAPEASTWWCLPAREHFNLQHVPNERSGMFTQCGDSGARPI